MARMDEVFMKNVAPKLIEIYNRTGLTKSGFCENLQVAPSYLSALQNEKNWSKIPAWVWFLFQNITNRMIEFNSKGEIIYVHNGYSLNEVHEDCKLKAGKMVKSEEKFDPYIEETEGEKKIDLDEFGIKKLPPDEKSVRLSEAMLNFMDYMSEFSERFVEFMIKTKEEEIKELKKIKEFSKRCKK